MTVVADVAAERHGPERAAGKAAGEEPRDFSLPAVSDDDIDAEFGGPSLVDRLRPASARDDNAVRPLPPKAPDNLAALPVGLGRHGTGDEYRRVPGSIVHEPRSIRFDGGSE